MSRKMKDKKSSKRQDDSKTEERNASRKPKDEDSEGNMILFTPSEILRLYQKYYPCKS